MDDYVVLNVNKVLSLSIDLEFFTQLKKEGMINMIVVDEQSFCNECGGMKQANPAHVRGCSLAGERSKSSANKKY